MLSFTAIKEHVVKKLEEGLSPLLTYHNVSHTLDVLTNVVEIAAGESIVNESDLLALKLGALYHDVGFLTMYAGHEEGSCIIATEELKNFGYSKEQIEKVCGMIRATRVPQSPKNCLEKIICDSDLDYLGREDFFLIAEGLYKEFLAHNVVANEKEWNELQVHFLENHHYFTLSSQQKRQEAKERNLQKVKEKLI